jgi:hypothetical protein
LESNSFIAFTVTYATASSCGPARHISDDWIGASAMTSSAMTLLPMTMYQ